MSHRRIKVARIGIPVIDPDSLRDMDTSHIALPYGNNARLPIQK